MGVYELVLKRRKTDKLTPMALILVDWLLWFMAYFIDGKYFLSRSLWWVFFAALQIINKAFLTVIFCRLHEGAYTDELTGLYNRRYFCKRVLKKRIKSPFALLLIDVDSFKSINDTYGHIVGDSVLRQFADILRKSTRKGDIIARWGGEEFVMALPRTEVDDAFYIADGIRRAVQEHRFYHEGVTCSITISIGIASISGKANLDDIEQFFITADKALYKAKEKRNYIIVNRI